MTVEIKQLIIRASVESRKHPETTASPVSPSATHDDREAIIAACAREVLRLLERATDR